MDLGLGQGLAVQDSADTHFAHHPFEFA